MQLLSMLHTPPDILFEITKISRIMKFEFNKIIVIVAISIPIMLKTPHSSYVHSLFLEESNNHSLCKINTDVLIA